MCTFTLWLAFALLIVVARRDATSGQALAQGTSDRMTPSPALRIAGNLYYVGSKDLADRRPHGLSSCVTCPLSVPMGPS